MRPPPPPRRQFEPQGQPELFQTATSLQTGYGFTVSNLKCLVFVDFTTCDPAHAAASQHTLQQQLSHRASHAAAVQR